MTQAFGDLVAHPLQRIERCHRLLEDHPDAPPADLLQRVFRRLRDVLAIEEHAPAHESTLRLGQEAEDRERRDALA